MTGRRTNYANRIKCTLISMNDEGYKRYQKQTINLEDVFYKIEVTTK